MKTKNINNTTLVLAVCLILLLVCIGCSSNREMRDRFKNGNVIVVVDEITGDRYTIEHYIGGNYAVKPLPKAN